MQSISPFLWFNRNAEEAIAFYCSLFESARLNSLTRYPSGMSQEHMRRMEGQVLNADFELAGSRFFAIDGGEEFKFTPALSLFVGSSEPAETERLWNALSAGGQTLMPLDEYPFSKKYGWCNDRYGLSWQLYTGAHKQRITPALMFAGEQFGKAEEAMNFYAAQFADSGVDAPARWPAGSAAAGKVLHGDFRLLGRQFKAMENNAPHDFNFTSAISFYVECDTQAEIDRYWDALPAGGGKHIVCGWLSDRFGIAWQIAPRTVRETLSRADEATVRRFMNAVMSMTKLDMAALEAAASGGQEPSSAG